MLSVAGKDVHGVGGLLSLRQTYLFGHLPHTVNELDEDGGSVLIRVVLVPVTYPLHTTTERRVDFEAREFTYQMLQHLAASGLTEANLWPKLIHSFSIKTCGRKTQM